MAICGTPVGYLDACLSTLGGVSRFIYLIAQSDFVSVSASVSGQILDTVALKASAKFYKFEALEDSVMFDENKEYSVDGNLVRQTLTFKLRKPSSEVLDFLSENTFVAIIDENAQDFKTIVGSGKIGLKYTEGTFSKTSGAVRGDKTVHTITLTSVANSFAPQIDVEPVTTYTGASPYVGEFLVDAI